MMILMFTSCSSMNSSFDCPNKAGINCKSLDEINAMIDSGSATGQKEFSNYKTVNGINDFDQYSYTTFKPGQPIRYGETVQRIWLAPYEDNEGNYHQENIIYTVVKDGHWIGYPVRSIKSA